MTPLKLAVIGGGHLGRFHTRLAAEMPQIELVGVADPSDAARGKLAEEFGVRAVADYHELLGDVEAAVIAAPTKLHHQIGLDLLAAGKHLLMEKPLAPTADECGDLVEAAEAHDLVLQVGHVEQFNPALDSAMPQLGTPRYIEATRLGGFTGRSTDIGVVLDMMIHDIDLVLSMVDAPVARVDAIGATVLGGHEDLANARVTFGDGTVATFNASRVSFKAQRTMHIWCEDGFASIDFAAHKGCLIKPTASLLSGELDIESLTASERKQFQETLFDDVLPVDWFQATAGNALQEELADLVDAVRTPRPPRVDGRQGWAAVALAEQILTAIDQQSAAQPPRILPDSRWDRAA
jgi:predicted dehydrogenase